MADRCVSVSFAVPVPSVPGVTVGFTPPSVAFDPKLCCKIANFAFAGPGVSIPLTGTLADALEFIEQAVDDFNQLAELNVTCPGNGPS